MPGGAFGRRRQCEQDQQRLRDPFPSPGHKHPTVYKELAAFSPGITVKQGGRLELSKWPFWENAPVVGQRKQLSQPLHVGVDARENSSAKVLALTLGCLLLSSLPNLKNRRQCTQLLRRRANCLRVDLQDFEGSLCSAGSGRCLHAYTKQCMRGHESVWFIQAANAAERYHMWTTRFVEVFGGRCYDCTAD